MLWIKAFHIIAMVTWFAGLFYLPRLFVYHAMSEDSTSIERFKIMERKLYYGIMTPGMVLTIVFGFWLLSYGFWGNWMIAKFVIVAITVGYHFYCGALVKTFARDQNTRGHVFYRFFNEIPVLFLVITVILVVVKPF